MPIEVSETHVLLPSRLVKWTPAWAVGHFTDMNHGQVVALAATHLKAGESFLQEFVDCSGSRLGRVTYSADKVVAEVKPDPDGDWQLWSFTYKQVAERKGGKRIDQPTEDASAA